MAQMVGSGQQMPNDSEKLRVATSGGVELDCGHGSLSSECRRVGGE